MQKNGEEKMSEMEKVKADKLTRKEKGQAKSRLKNMLMFLPNMVKLLGNLLTDGRVPVIDKALFAAAIVYVIVPLDLIPDIFPFIGQVDDLYLVALTLVRLINRTDEAVVRENWSGGGDIVSLANSVAKLAPMLLPQRVSRVLSANVELTNAGQTLQNITKKKNPLMAVKAESEKDDSEKIKVASPS
jgi:uncharacterized membrane protein YkvA (DUF1232 family)